METTAELLFVVGERAREAAVFKTFTAYQDVVFAWTALTHMTSTTLPAPECLSLAPSNPLQAVTHKQVVSLSTSFPTNLIMRPSKPLWTIITKTMLMILAIAKIENLTKALTPSSLPRLTSSSMFTPKVRVVEKSQPASYHFIADNQLSAASIQSYRSAATSNAS
ncbi:hypothetical protein K435DRAFT_875930 [Dendrothele bispora CBS 962.96]|uniref:Uncharacterized protein n=1 Tax=Dendrothele bispora (strain CBS 962.96) TaxID=1314807 RepID=A0A4S8KTM9_DENBC|nr:hypothetical protein K435DRAFT_875930 [Dendrothele bispora CBS 962.96]